MPTPPSGSQGAGSARTVDLLADLGRIEAGTETGLRYVDLSRESGLWAIRDPGAIRKWEQASAGGIPGAALGKDPLGLRIVADGEGPWCVTFIVGADERTDVVFRAGKGKPARTWVGGGQSVVPGPCPLPDAPSYTDLGIGAGTEGKAVLAGFWIHAQGATVPPGPAAAPAACDGQEGAILAPGQILRTTIIAVPGSKVGATGSGTGASSLGASIRADGTGAPRAIALSGAGDGEVAGEADPGADAGRAIELEAALPAGAAGPVCVRLTLELQEAQAAVDGPARFDAVVLVVSDTMRGDLYPGSNTGMEVPMPAIQALMAGSTVFAGATAHTDYTKPSVASILSGLYPSDTGALPRPAPVDKGVVLVTERLEKAGVQTVGFMSNYFFNPAFGLRRGWTVQKFVDPWVAAVDDKVVLDALDEWAKAGVPKGPLFVYVHLMGAHAPYAPPRDIQDIFLGGEDLLQRIVPLETSNLVTDLTVGKAKRLSKGETDQLRALYRGDAAFHDRIVARLLESLEAAGLAKRALLVYTADHGEEFYENGHVGHGTGLWHHQVHVPLFVRVPGEKGGVSTTTAGHVDIVPTILEALGQPAPDGLPGRSLLGIAAAAPEPGRGLLLQQWMGRWGIVVGEWKLVRREDEETLSRIHGAVEEILEAGAHPVLARYLAARIAWARLDGLAAAGAAGAGGDGGAAQISPEVTEQLKKLGYILE